MPQSTVNTALSGPLETPRVSVLLPVRNGATTLDEAIDSIRSQSLRAWELVVVDDGSTDGTDRVLAQHARQDSRIRVLRQEASGIVAALEAARRAATAPFLARMDADDRSAPDRLGIQLAFLEAHPEVALCGTHVRYFPRRAVRAGARRYEAWLCSLESSDDLVRDLWVECPLAHPSFFMRVAAVEAVGGYRDAGWAEDYDLVLRLWAAGHGIGVVPQVLLDWREGTDRLSRRSPAYAPEAFRRAKLHFLAKTLLRERDGLVVWGAGPIGKAMAREALKAAIPVRAFVELDPRKVGQKVHSAPVVPRHEVNRFRESLVLAAVGRPGARAEIREELLRMGWVEGVDFVAVA